MTEDSWSVYHMSSINIKFRIVWTNSQDLEFFRRLGSENQVLFYTVNILVLFLALVLFSTFFISFIRDPIADFFKSFFTPQQVSSSVLMGSVMKILKRRKGHHWEIYVDMLESLCILNPWAKRSSLVKQTNTITLTLAASFHPKGQLAAPQPYNKSMKNRLKYKVCATRETSSWSCWSPIDWWTCFLSLTV